MKAALVLLLLTLIMGMGAFAAAAGEEPGIQIILILDQVLAPAKDQAQNTLPQAASLLLHLLKEQDSLGLLTTAGQESLLSAPSRLTPEHRALVLGKLAGLAPGPQDEPLSKVLPQALEAVRLEGLAPRVLLILSDQSKKNDNQSKTGSTEEDKHFAALAQKAGVTICAVALSPDAPSEELKILTSATGGSLWVGRNPRDLNASMLKFYQRLAQPQEAPLRGTDFHFDQWVRQAVVAAAPSAPGQEVVLTNPNGARISRRTPVKNIQWLAGQGYDLITMLQPRPGDWRISSAQGDTCKVFLTTDLTLTTAGIPPQVGADEALLVTAALKNETGSAPGVNALAEVEWRAELQTAPGQRLSVPFQVQEGAADKAESSGVRAARFPPLHQEGEATLTVMALGKTIQRVVSRPIAVIPPWYRVAKSAQGRGKEPATVFQPVPVQPPEKLEGCVTLQSQGGLAGVLISPLPGAEIVVKEPPGCQGSCSAGLFLKGVAAGGRPLDIASGPAPEARQSIPAKAGEFAPPSDTKEKVQAPPAGKKKRGWLWLAFVGLGMVVLLAAALMFWQDRPGAGSPKDGVDRGDAGNNFLRLQAQLEALSKEKAQLQAALGEKNLEAGNLLAEKADLQAELERISTRTKGNVHSIEELEKKLEQAEQEAKGVQKEYMALYARSQQEKEAIKKN